MEKIYFLATDQVMKHKIEQALWKRSKEPGNMPIEVAILDFENIEGQAQGMIKKGAQVIIASGGTYQELLPVIHEIPLLRLYISTYDIIYTLEQAREYKKIHLFLNDSVIFELTMCSEVLRNKIEIHTYKERTSLQRLLENLEISPDTAIVGTAILPRITNIPMPIFTIMPSNPTIFSLYQYARDLVLFNKRERQQLSLFTTVLSQVEEGIIIYDERGRISHINARAKRFLRCADGATTMAEVFPDMERTQLLSFSDVIIERPPYTLVLNSTSFSLDKQSCYIVSIRDVTQLQQLEKNIRYKLSKTGLTATHRFDDILTVDAKMEALKATAETMAAYHAPILIQGESGTGKELFAQSIHNASPHRNGPFVAINCAALPPELLESELFGYESGAFTGARKKGKAGLFELAHNGTIFLDEINSMTPAIQSKLLRVLETKQVMRIGSDYVIPLDIRVISASNSSLIESITEGAFRKDLYFRLNTLTITLPSLDERPGDIIYLFAHFLSEFTGYPVKTDDIPKALQQALTAHHWWGNIREIRSTALRYHIYGQTEASSYDYLFDRQVQKRATHMLDPKTFKLDMKKAQHTFQQLVINELLEQGYTKTEVASMLNITRQTLFNHLKE